MRVLIAICSGVVFLLTLPIAFGQNFINLNFEQATVSPIPAGGYGDYVDPTLAFPGWTARTPNPWQGDVILYNVISLSAPAAILMGPEFPNGPNVYPAIEGAYSALLLYPDPLNNPSELPSLSQTGLIPSDARSISLVCASDPSTARVIVGGTNIPLYTIDYDLNADFPIYRLGGDVTAFAGRSVELVLTLSSKSDYWFYFDDIRFSPTTVPESGSLSLLGLAALIFRFRHITNRPHAKR